MVVLFLNRPFVHVSDQIFKWADCSHTPMTPPLGLSGSGVILTPELMLQICSLTLTFIHQFWKEPFACRWLRSSVLRTHVYWCEMLLRSDVKAQDSSGNKAILIKCFHFLFLFFFRGGRIIEILPEGKSQRSYPFAEACVHPSNNLSLSSWAFNEVRLRCPDPLRSAEFK